MKNDATDSDIKYDKRCLIYGLLSVMTFSMMLALNIFINEKTAVRTFMYTLSFVYAGYMFGYSIYLKKKHNIKLKCNAGATAAILAILALFLYAVSDGLVNTCFFFKARPLFILLGYMFYFIPVVIGAFLFKNPRIWYIAATVLVVAFSILQHYILLFRGSIFTVSDFANIKSAFAIKSSYSFKIDIQIVFTILFTSAAIYGLMHINYSVISLKIRIASLISMICVVIFTVFALSRIYNSSSSRSGIYFGRTFLSTMSPTVSTGLALMFYYDSMYNILEEPENYDTAEAEAIINQMRM